MEIYESSNPIVIEEYAKKLIGHTFNDVYHHTFFPAKKTFIDSDSYKSGKRKGGLGNLIEEAYFGYKANSTSEADFAAAGVELKVTPYEETKKGAYRAGERLVLSMIDYNSAMTPEIEKSHFWSKNRLLLLIYYHRDKTTDSFSFLINYASLFTPPEKDLEIIKQDYQTIYNKISHGKANELSESDTNYLGACTKGATAATSYAKQYYYPYTKAKKRAYCYKNSYMTFVLNTYIVPGITTYSQAPLLDGCEPIIKNVNELKRNTFTSIIYEKINKHIGQTDKELCRLFNREYNNNKAQWTDLSYRMLGIKNNRAEEFQKANIVVKVIRIEENGSIRESMSFPPFKYKEIIKETWDDSTLRDYFEETKFLFVVFKKNKDTYKLTGCQFWNMPIPDIDGELKTGWEAVVKTIKDGVELEIDDSNSEKILVKNNFPKKTDNKILHVRPHATKRYYEFNDGKIIGDGTRSDANQLPDGRWMPHYSFWLNNDYVLKQLDSNLK